MLKIRNVTKKIKDTPILNNVSLDIAHGEIAVLLGQSGVGKSTLLRVLNNLETADSATVELDGVPLDLHTINKNHTIGMVFQHFNLFEHLTVIQNITIALEHVAHQTTDEAHKRACTLLEQYGLLDKADDSIIQLSGGQKQRLALARTLALHPAIICLDEPTSALDPLLTIHVAQTIKELAKQGYIVLVTTHDIHLLQKLPCTIHLMQSGSIIESAHADHFFAHPEKYSRIAAFVGGV